MMDGAEIVRSGQPESRAFAGRHLIIDVIGGEGLDDPAGIERALCDAARAAEATLLHIYVHRFSPQGVTGVAVLAESHITVHTWPELGYAAFDAFLCGGEPRAIVDVLARAFDAGDIRVRELHRGEGLIG